METVTDFIFLSSRITADGDYSHEIKRHLLLERKAVTNTRQHTKKQRHYFANRGPSRQSYGFCSSHVWMLELDHKQSWALKNWCFWTVVLEKPLESPLDCKEIKLVNSKGNNPWIFIGRTDAEAPILWPPDVKNWLIAKDPDARKDWRQEEKGTKDEMVEMVESFLNFQSRHHWLDGHEFEQAPGVDGHRSLVCCNPWGRKESDMTERLNWWLSFCILSFCFLDSTFWCTKNFNSYVQFIYLFFWVLCAFGIIFKKLKANPKSSRFTPVFTSKSFIVWWCKAGVELYCFTCGHSVFQHHL